MGRPSAITPEREAIIRELDAKGFSPDTIALKVGVSESTIWRYLKRPKSEAIAAAKAVRVTGASIATEPLERQRARLEWVSGMLDRIGGELEAEPGRARLFSTLLRCESQLEESIERMTPRASSEATRLEALGEIARQALVERAQARVAARRAAGG